MGHLRGQHHLVGLDQPRLARGLVPDGHEGCVEGILGLGQGQVLVGHVVGAQLQVWTQPR